MQLGTIGNYLNLVKQFNEFMFCDKSKDVNMGDCHLMMATLFQLFVTCGK